MVHVKLGSLGHILLTTDCDFIEFLLSVSKVLKRPDQIRFLESWLGNGLLVANGIFFIIHIISNTTRGYEIAGNLRSHYTSIWSISVFGNCLRNKYE
jgi:hypothetical protein